MIAIQCTNCRQAYPQEEAPYHCPRCGGLYDYTTPLSFDPSQVEPALPGIWRYRHTFGLPEAAPQISLGEGSTALVWTEAFGRQVAFKCEFQNPSGSFKDRGSATLVSFLCSRGVHEAVEDSSGNAGASFAAYAARAGIKARVYVPESASGPKRRQIEAYGAQVVAVPGPRSNAAEAVRQAADAGTAYASHAYLPYNLPGYATAAYEIFEQLGEAPGTVIVPAGQGGFLLGMARGFAAMRNAGLFQEMPLLVGVQASLCAPLWALFSYGRAGLAWVAEGPTLAEGIRVSFPLRGDEILRTLETNQGLLVAVDEENILPGWRELAQRGLYVEPTSAVVWNAMAQLADRLRDPVVAVLTGSGLKWAG